MKLLAVFSAILAFAASCYTNTHSVKNTCIFPDESSIKQPDKEDVLGPNFRHSLNTLVNLPSEFLNNDKVVYMASPNVLPMNSAKLIEASRSYAVMPDPAPCINTKGLLEECLDNNRDFKDDTAIEMPLPNGPHISSAKLIDASRSYAVMPNPSHCIDIKGLLEEYLDNNRDLKNDKPNEMGLRNVPPKSLTKLIETSSNYAVVPDHSSCIDLLRKQEELLDYNWDLRNKKSITKESRTGPVKTKALRSSPFPSYLKTLIGLIRKVRKQKDRSDDKEDQKNDKLNEILKSYFSDNIPFKDLTRRNQEYFDDEEDLKDINAADLENIYINENYNFVPKASSSYLDNY